MYQARAALVVNLCYYNSLSAEYIVCCCVASILILTKHKYMSIAFL